MYRFIIRLIQRYKLKQLPNLHIKNYISLSDAQNIGFIFCSSDQNIIDLVIPFYDKMVSMGKKCNGIGVSIIKQETPQTPFMPPSLDIVQLYRTDINKVGIPTTTQVEEFLNREYDIIFDLSSSPLFTLEYLLKRSKSHTIVGYSHIRESYHDLTFFSEGEKSIDAETVFKSFDYLLNIKSK